MGGGNARLPTGDRPPLGPATDASYQMGACGRAPARVRRRYHRGMTERKTDSPASTEQPDNAGPEILLPAPVTLADLASELFWPRLLRAGKLAFRADRMAIALLTVILIGVVGSLNTLFGGRSFIGGVLAVKIEAFGSLLASIAALDVGGAGDALLGIGVGVPARIASEFPVSIWALGIPIVVVWAIGLGAICRSAACEFGVGVFRPWPESLAFSLRRGVRMVSALVLPALLAGVSLFGAWVLGLLTDVPFIEYAAAVVYPISLILVFAGVLTLVLYVFGGHMLVPCVACEGTDGIDALQRAGHYSMHRPLRLVLYLSILGLVGAVLLGIAFWLAWAVPTLADALRPEPAGEAILTDSDRLRGVNAIIAFWSKVPGVIAAALAVSYYACASTLLYLAMRQQCDGQHYSEIWFEGVSESTLVEAERSGERLIGRQQTEDDQEGREQEADARPS